MSSCRITAARPAPSACRIAISFRRPLARASERFARFAQAISRMQPTAASSTSSDVRTLPVEISGSGIATASFSALLFGYAAARRRAMAVTSAGPAQVAPGASRAKMRSVLIARSCAFPGGNTSGV